MSEELEDLDVSCSTPPRRALLGPLARLAGALAGAAASACGDADESRAAGPAATPATLAGANAGETAPPLGASGVRPSGKETPAGDRARPSIALDDASVAAGQAGDAGTTASGAHPCARPTRFLPFSDKGPRTSFRRTDDSTTLDWGVIALNLTVHAAALPDRIMRLLGELDELYIGHPFSMLEHSLHAAARARRDAATDDWVIAALCHRIGMTVSVANYAELSAAIMRGYISDDAYRAVAHLADFVRTPEAGESDRVASRTRHQTQPWFAAATRFADVWLSPVRASGERPLALAELEPLVRSSFTQLAPEPYTTKTDCF